MSLFAALNAAAIVFALLAAMVNVFVGPLNAAMWIVPLFMAGVATIISVLAQGARLQAERPFSANWMVGTILGKRLAKRFAYLLHCLYESNMKVVLPIFLYLVPLAFLVLAVLLLILSARGQIAPGS
ncbi:MAG: hypothetical protein WD845_14640 [Pirellulales bacterium]